MTAHREPAGAPSPVADPYLVEALRGDLLRVDLTVETVEDLVGPLASAALHREQSVPALLAVQRAGAVPLATLVQLLVLGRPVPRSALDAAAPATGTAGLVRLGLVAAAGSGPDDEVRPLVDLRPYHAVDAAGPVDWWIASDRGEAATGAGVATDHVLGVGGASTTLVQLTVRDQRRRTLDLGTGSGIQALHASRHSAEVVATDLSRRALAFAALNAALAGVRLDLRHGSMLEPVLRGPGGTEAESEGLFDLVVSNPPFVITPPTLARYEYRDGGRSGDDLVRDLVQQVGGVLAPGGVAQLLGNWEHRAGQDWRERVGGWLDASGLDGWVVQRDVQDPAEYAETWLRDGGTTPGRDPDGWREGYTAWLADLASRQVEAVGFGFLTLRRPEDGPVTLRRLEERTGPVRQPLGEHVRAVLAAHDRLVARDDAALAHAHLVVAPDVTEERYLVPGAGEPTVILLRQGEGFGRAVRAGTALAGLVGACDGELSVGQVVDALAGLLEVDPGALSAELLPQVRDLVRDAMLRFD